MSYSKISEHRLNEFIRKGVVRERKSEHSIGRFGWFVIGFFTSTLLTKYCYYSADAFLICIEVLVVLTFAWSVYKGIQVIKSQQR